MFDLNRMSLETRKINAHRVLDILTFQKMYEEPQHAKREEVLYLGPAYAGFSPLGKYDCDTIVYEYASKLMDILNTLADDVQLYYEDGFDYIEEEDAEKIDKELQNFKGKVSTWRYNLPKGYTEGLTIYKTINKMIAVLSENSLKYILEANESWIDALGVNNMEEVSIF